MLVLRFASLHEHRHLVATLVKARRGPPIHIGGYAAYRQFRRDGVAGFGRRLKSGSRPFAERPGTVPPSGASWKSTCFLKLSTLATCTRTWSPSRIIRRVRRPTSWLRSESNR